MLQLRGSAFFLMCLSDKNLICITLGSLPCKTVNIMFLAGAIYPSNGRVGCDFKKGLSLSRLMLVFAN